MSELNQRHNLVLLFTDLSDSTRIAARLEPEQYAELLQQLRGLLTTIVSRHGGEIARIDGDGALCIFGYPVAHEDAGRRATEAALDLHAATTELAASLGGEQGSITLHSGIHAGVVLLRSGDLVRGRYEMLGDATNVAARLCDAAGADGILVSDATLGGDRHFFSVAPQRRIALAGHGETLAAWPVTGREDLPHRFAAREKRGLTPFVGREEERAKFREWLQDEVAASPLLLIHGPAGIGKSRLLSLLEHDAAQAGWQVAMGYCESYLGARPLQPFHQIAATLALAGSAALELTQAISEVSMRARLILFVDDWQWADDASRGLLADICDQREAGSLRIVLLSRQAELEPELETNSTAIALPPLSHHATSRTISNLLPASDPFSVERIVAAAGGSPLLIEELCHAYASGAGDLNTDPRGAWFDLAVQARFARLGRSDAELLHKAAVIGHFVPTWLLADLNHGPIAGATLERLESADFLFADDHGDVLRFKHGLTRDAVYAGIGLKQRTALHAAVLAVIERRAEMAGEAQLLDALAYHSWAAAKPELALAYAIKAGNAALATGALDRAQGHYRVAFELIEQGRTTRSDDQLRHVIKMYGRSCVSDPGREHVPLLERMLILAEASGDNEAITLATYWIGAHYYGLGEPLRSLAQLERAYSLVRDRGSESFIAQVEANLGQSNAIACRYDRAIGFMDRSIEKKYKVWSPDQPSSSLAYCLSARALILADMGRFDESAKCFEAAQLTGAGTELRTFPSIETQRALAAAFRGDFESALERAIPAEEAARKSRSRTLVFAARAIANHARWRLTGKRSALDILVEVTLTLLANDQQQRLSFMLGWIAEAMAELRQDAATRLFAKQTFKATFKGDRLGEAGAARALAALAARSGGQKGFQYYLAMADRAAERRNSVREKALNRICEANCLHWSGDSTAARSLAECAANQCTTLDLHHWQLAFD